MARKKSNGVSVKVNRNAPVQALQPFTDYFQGFEKVGAVRKVFGDETGAVLRRLRVGFMSNKQMYMGIRDHDGNIAVGTYHLRHSTTRTLYLDIVHELFHIGQWMKDKEWFTAEHEKFMGNGALYYVSPLEVPAYAHTVREAERLGMSRDEIVEYLKMMPTSSKIWNGFLDEMGLGKSAPARESKARSKRAARLPVKINRNPKLVLRSFEDYFQGFQDAPPVKELFGKAAKNAIGGLKVEFIESPFGTIFPSEEDGHLVVNSSFLREAELEAVYLDVVLCLNFLKRASASGTAALDSGVEFGENPVVVESYEAMVSEARRIGVPDAKVMERLMMPKFMMSAPAFGRFVEAIGLRKQG